MDAGGMNNVLMSTAWLLYSMGHASWHALVTIDSYIMLIIAPAGVH